jgi:hypothetical protein
VGGKRVVNKWLFELKTNELLARDLRASYPKNWLEIFKAKSEDEKIVRCIQMIIENTTPTTRIKRNRKGLNHYIK